LDRVNTSVLATVGQQSAALQNLQGITQHNQAVQLTAQKQITNIKGADLSQVVVGLQEQQNLLQATLYSASQVVNENLVYFLTH
jgi:hypothetical protein